MKNKKNKNKDLKSITKTVQMDGFCNTLCFKEGKGLKGRLKDRLRDRLKDAEERWERVVDFREIKRERVDVKEVLVRL